MTRSAAERQQLGLELEGAAYNTERTEAEEERVAAGEVGLADGVVVIPEHCPGCAREGAMKMHETDIPHFQRILIFAFKCDFCGFKSNEIKSSGAIPEQATRWTLAVGNEADLSRDVLKSGSTVLIVPEIDLEVTAGTFGGFFSTGKGALQQGHGNPWGGEQCDMFRTNNCSCRRSSPGLSRR